MVLVYGLEVVAGGWWGGGVVIKNIKHKSISRSSYHRVEGHDKINRLVKF